VQGSGARNERGERGKSILDVNVNVKGKYGGEEWQGTAKRKDGRGGRN
jgi:hypothetical protein